MLLKRIKMSQPFPRQIDVVPEHGFSPLYREIYQNLNLTLFVGRNGSGKTEAMSLVARVFHYLQRSRERIVGDFTIDYSVQRSGIATDVSIARLGDGEITIRIGGEPPRTIAPWSTRDRASPARHPNEYSYADLTEVLPSQIVVSAFSTRGEYPVRRPGHYVGDQRVALFDVGEIYGKNHFGIRSLSRGISELAALFLTGSPSIAPLRDLLGLTFTGRIRIHDTISDTGAPPSIVSKPYDRRQPRPDEPFHEWLPFSPRLQHRELAEEVYFNDLELQREGRTISLLSMSSGEKVLFVRILSLLSAVTDNTLVLIEEPELHLDPSWSKQWITILHALFSERNAHFIVSTHSHSFINSVFSENIVHFRMGETSFPGFETFLSSESDIAHRFFADGSQPNSPEAFVAAQMRSGNRERLQGFLKKMGESHTRFQVFRAASAGKPDVESSK